MGKEVVKNTIEETCVGISAPGTVANGPLDFLGEVKARSVHMGFGGFLGSHKVQAAYREEGRENRDGVGTHVEQFCT